MAGLKFMLILWLASVAGGPYTYMPTRKGKCPFSLENGHAALQIAPEEFAKTLDFYKIADPERQEVLAAFAAHKNEVNMGYNVAHGLPQAPIIC